MNKQSLAKIEQDKKEKGKIMLSLIIILTSLFTVHTGVRRGAVLQGVYTLGYLFSFIYAAKNYIKYVDKLELLIPYPQPTPSLNYYFFHRDVFLT